MAELSRATGLISTYVGYPYFFGPNWCAKCIACGKPLTKFCFEEEDARREAEAALREHRCTMARVGA